MTRGDLPPDFRARVIARIERGDEDRWTGRPTWALAPLAVAAAVLFAVLIVRTPWRSAGSGASHVGSDDHRIAPAAATSSAVDVPRLKRDPTDATDRPRTSLPGSDPGRKTSSGRTAAVRRTPDATGEGGVPSDLTPAPIQIESLDVKAMGPTEVALSVAAMGAIDVPRLDVTPLELPAIGEQ